MSTTIREVELRIPDQSLTGRSLSPNAEIEATQMKQQANKLLSVPFSSLRVWDALHSNLPAAAASDDLGIATGTPGTHAPKISTGDLKGLGSTARKATFEYEVPANWDNNQSLELVIRAGMQTTVADTSAQLAVAVHLPDGDGAVGASICATSAQDMNSLTPNDLIFAITPSSVSPGDKLMVVITITVNDGATATEVTGIIYAIHRRLDLRG